MKKCPQCGKMYSDLVKICPDCKISLCGESETATSIHQNSPSNGYTPIQPRPQNQQTQSLAANQNNGVPYTTSTVPSSQITTPVNRGVSFFEAVKLFFTHYGDFSSRSCRSEIWWTALFNFIVVLLLSLIFPPIISVWTLATLIPGIAQFVRRFHDVGKSGWWYLMVLIPLVGQIFLLVHTFIRSDGPNNWGAGPNTGN